VGEAGGRDGETEPGEEKKQGLHREGEKGRGETEISPTIVFIPAEKKRAQNISFEREPASSSSSFLYL
jgi:hypothetical protein